MNKEQRAMMRELSRKFMAAGQGKLVEGGWQGFRDTSIAPDAPEAQLTDMKASFFAGATYVFLTVTAAIQNDTPQDETLATITALSSELVEYSKALSALMGAGLKTKGNA
jgi:hypothetical protein